MATVTLEKRVRALEVEMVELRKAARPTFGIALAPTATRAQKIKAKKLPKWLQDSLDDVAQGRVSGPFKTVAELRAHLVKR